MDTRETRACSGLVNRVASHTLAQPVVRIKRVLANQIALGFTRKTAIS
jgi:hypothetical protein